MNNYEFDGSILVQRISSLCDSHNITIKQLEREIGLGNGAIRRWSTSVPSVAAVAKVACYFTVSIDYLVGLSHIPARTDAVAPQTAWLIGVFERLPVDVREKAIEVLKVMNPEYFVDSIE